LRPSRRRLLRLKLACETAEYTDFTVVIELNAIGIGGGFEPERLAFLVRNAAAQGVLQPR